VVHELDGMQSLAKTILEGGQMKESQFCALFGLLCFVIAAQLYPASFICVIAFSVGCGAFAMSVIEALFGKDK
jgi:hypothetical protein